MPILFKTEWKESGIHGKGIFAIEDIPKGSVWWTADQKIPGISPQNCIASQNEIYDDQSINQLGKAKTFQQMVDILNITMYFQGGDKLIYLKDGSGLLNHSPNPNSECKVFEAGNDYRKLKSVALVDIKAGQQIVQNYEFYTKARGNWVERVFNKYIPSRISFQSQFNIKKAESDLKA